MFEKQIDRQIEELLQPMQERCEKLEKHIAQLKKQVNEMQSRMEDMQNQIEKLHQPVLACNVVEPVINDHEPAFYTPSNGPKVLFLHAPNVDGVFTESSPTEQIGKSIYQLSTKDQVNGSFIMLDTPDAIATAMISVSQFVKPVCKVIGNISVLPRNIITEEEGTAVCENGSWRVINKAVVRFE